MLEKELQIALCTAFGEQYRSLDPLIFVSKGNSGDYQSNIAMPLSKALKLAPKVVAEKIVESLPHGNTAIQSVDISGPGFINLYLSKELIAKSILTGVTDKESRAGIPTVDRQEVIVIDFSSPNIAKQMHVVSRLFLSSKKLLVNVCVI